MVYDVLRAIIGARHAVRKPVASADLPTVDSVAPAEWAQEQDLKTINHRELLYSFVRYAATAYPGETVMNRRSSQLWTNLAVAVLGLLVGVDNLLRWLDDASSTRSLLIGGICTLLAIGWLVYVLSAKDPNE